ncbi:LysR family transcriptional regulator [Orrella daihaiensis]|uniref:LysR family transcriptional regulator n=1 Tax=Orrella daihaiensis TaxID=2782176 RepID=A0ABY4AND1_9BURK|nr:LysR family transcriptional regulator [Orrella daihaiensis]
MALEQALSSGTTDKRIEVLRAIGRLGSISEAARANGVSYKAAWQAIETLTNLAATPLLQKVVGGAGGGGARLTPAGEQLLRAADHLHQARAIALAEIQGQTTEPSGTISNIASLALRTSMRNQLPCTVAAIERPHGAPRIWLELTDGQRLSARITRESLELLNLSVGMPVLALCKATAVTIAPTIVAMGEVNLLKGHVTKRLGVKSDGQVSLTIGQGLQVAGFVSAGAQLKLKQVATAAIAESAIVIGLTG